ncbi:MAG: capsule assembly Wzi family protein [Treponema sp.]|jgi:hypothetical protein|nr:capsule assembly Wzi family protein [Treponema sp.]
MLICLFLAGILPAQEALKSAEEEYYGFLVLQGFAERPTLNYRTLSDSVWDIADDTEHPWQEQNLRRFYSLFGDFRMKVYGPELFMSGNTAAPYGHNDGVLWQGRGFNALFKTGVRFEGYGVELTLLPHFAFSQNAHFEIMPSPYESEYGYFWKYERPNSNKGKGGVDAPQRFGDEPFFDWDFGDSEIRYTWKTMTIGFGTQAIWLGPAYFTPILHSNNAPAYPKFDIGLRRQSVTIPWLDWYIGDVEIRLWTGCLEKSDYYDDDDSNRYTMIHGAAFAYAPSFIPGFTFFLNWVDLLPWEWEYAPYILPVDTSNELPDDMKLSFGFSWVIQQIGFEVYWEMGIDDYSPGFLRHLFHAVVYTGGLRKTFKIKPEKNIYFQVLFEYSWMEMTQDFQLQWQYSYYFHHQIIHGYTNRGQWLGNGISPGGNSQYLLFTLYYPRGKSSAFVNRNNPDSNFIYKKAVYASAEEGNLESLWHQHKVNIIAGLSTDYFLNSRFLLSGSIAYNMITNPIYYYDNAQEITFLHNWSFQTCVKLLLN